MTKITFFLTTNMKNQKADDKWNTAFIKDHKRLICLKYLKCGKKKKTWSKNNIK